MPFIATVALVLLLIAWLVGEPFWVERRRDRLRARPFPAAWREILRRRVPYVRSLPADLQWQLKRHIQVFLAEKPFIGCAGQLIDDEVRVTIAAQACLLLLNRRHPRYFPGLRQILVYPGAFAVDRVQTDGAVVQDQRQALSGESWSQGIPKGIRMLPTPCFAMRCSAKTPTQRRPAPMFTSSRSLRFRRNLSSSGKVHMAPTSAGCP